MVLRILICLFFSFPFLFAHNMSHSLGNIQPTSVEHFTYSRTTIESTYLSSNFTLSFLSALAQNYTSSNLKTRSSQNKKSDALRQREVNLTEYSPRVFCKFQPNGYDCDESGIRTPKFYYDLKMESCKTFYFGQCKMDFNRFDALPDCHEKCLDQGNQELFEELPANIYCKLQPDFGKCNEYHPMWYYDVSNRDCRGFSYSGCGGNLNRFTTHQLCIALCSNLEE